MSTMACVVDATTVSTSPALCVVKSFTAMIITRPTRTYVTAVERPSVQRLPMSCGVEIEDLAGSWSGEETEISRLQKLLKYARKLK